MLALLLIDRFLLLCRDEMLEFWPKGLDKREKEALPYDFVRTNGSDTPSILCFMAAFLSG